MIATIVIVSLALVWLGYVGSDILKRINALKGNDNDKSRN